jgi:hypothetical protein
MNAPGGDSFDQWLGQTLQQHASAHSAPSPMPVQAQYHAAYLQSGLHLPFLAKVGAVLTAKAAIAATVGVLVAAAAGEAVVTGSVNPADWGQQVVQQVQKCKDALAPGSHGIGSCVSSFANQHGKTESSDHRANPTPGRGQGNKHTPGPPDKTHPTPPASPGKSGSHPTPPVHPTPPGNGHKKP